MSRNPYQSFARSRQSGAALLVAVVLLLLAGVISVLALNVGIFEQRSTSNDLRAKVVNEVAEAGLSQGFEFLMRQRPGWMEEGTRWELCAGNDTSFPCGAVSDAPYDHDFDAGTAAIPRRATMFRMVGSGHTITGFDTDKMTQHMLPLPNPIADVGGFSVAYGVAPVLCYVAPRAVGELDTDPVRCATDVAQATGRRVATFVSVGSMPGEAARTTLVQTVGRYALLEDPLGLPPITAAGSVDITGSLQVVTNPNGGGAGVPVSVWTRKDVEKTGTPNTCYTDEFFRFGAKNNTPPTFLDGTIVCDTCQCQGDQSLSYDKSGNLQTEGIDILDVEGDSTAGYQVGGHEGINYNVRSDELSFPVCEFPPDLFAFVFGVKAWEDTDSDCFAETKVMQEYTNPNTGLPVTMGADEAYLYQNAAAIINPTVEGQPLVSTAQTYAGAYPSADLSGVIWCQSNCDVGSNTQLGRANKPVVLVIDGSARIQGRVFGLVFLRNKAGGGTLTPVAGYTMTSAEVDEGGNATLDMNAGAVIYGALVMQGKVDKANGTAAVVFNADVLKAIGQDPDGNRYATLPGAWNDNRSY